MTYKSSVNKFVKTADWLTDADLPAVEALKGCAEALDASKAAGQLSPALVGQYRLLHKQLLEGRTAPADNEEDPFTPKEDQ